MLKYHYDDKLEASNSHASGKAECMLLLVVSTSINYKSEPLRADTFLALAPDSEATLITNIAFLIETATLNVSYYPEIPAHKKAPLERDGHMYEASRCLDASASESETVLKPRHST
jgi:hypothetical protein